MIQPVMDSGEWLREDARLAVSSEQIRVLRHGPHVRLHVAKGGQELQLEGAMPLTKLIALANAALLDGDPRKITRHSVWIIRKLLEEAQIDNMHPGAMRFRREAEQLADALESYLPPEPA